MNRRYLRVGVFFQSLLIVPPSGGISRTACVGACRNRGVQIAALDYFDGEAVCTNLRDTNFAGFKPGGNGIDAG